MYMIFAKLFFLPFLEDLMHNHTSIEEILLYNDLLNSMDENAHDLIDLKKNKKKKITIIVSYIKFFNEKKLLKNKPIED